MAGTGLPDVDSFGRYGGPLQNKGPLDPWTESAEQRNLYAMNVAMMTHTITRAFRTFLGPTAGQSIAPVDPPTGLAHDSVWPAIATGMKPVVSGSNGVFDIAWPTMITDDFGNKRLLSIKRAEATVESLDGTWYDATATVINNRTVRVYTYDLSLGAPTSQNNAPGQPITVWIR